MAVTEIVIKTEERAEINRTLDNKLGIEQFGWLHLPCKDVVSQRGVINSSKNDSASGDPEPIFTIRLHCNKHNVSSLPEEK
jgi:hypothetical protein